MTFLIIGFVFHVKIILIKLICYKFPIPIKFCIIDYFNVTPTVFKILRLVYCSAPYISLFVIATHT